MKALAAALSLTLALASSSAFASDVPKSKSEESGQYVAVSPVGLPVVAGGKVVNYIFVTVRIDLSPSANAAKLREREPYFRDALVRAGNRTPFTLASDYTKIDEARLVASMTRDAIAIAGPGAVRSVKVVSQAPKSLRVPKPL
jgi:hypothetical protein